MDRRPLAGETMRLGLVWRRTGVARQHLNHRQRKDTRRPLGLGLEQWVALTEGSPGVVSSPGRHKGRTSLLHPCEIHATMFAHVLPGCHCAPFPASPRDWELWGISLLFGTHSYFHIFRSLSSYPVAVLHFFLVDLGALFTYGGDYGGCRLPGVR